MIIYKLASERAPSCEQFETLFSIARKAAGTRRAYLKLFLTRKTPRRSGLAASSCCRIRISSLTRSVLSKVRRSDCVPGLTAGDISAIFLQGAIIAGVERSCCSGARAHLGISYIQIRVRGCRPTISGRVDCGIMCGTRLAGIAVVIDSYSPRVAALLPPSPPARVRLNTEFALPAGMDDNLGRGSAGLPERSVADARAGTVHAVAVFGCAKPLLYLLDADHRTLARSASSDWSRPGG